MDEPKGAKSLVYAWGNARYGRLGLGDVSALPRDHDDPNEVYRPCAAIMTALSAKGVTQVACGTWHALALTPAGHVYAWGLAKHGLLGANVDAHGGALPVDADSADAYSPTPFLVAGLHGRPVTQVACGNLHNLALVRGGDVFAWGCARYGLLGVGTEHRQLKHGSEGSFSPTPVHVVGAGCGEQVTQVACGKYHCLVRTAAGGVCTWGSARWGLMGTASTDELEHTGDSTEWFQPRPTRVVLEGGDTTVVQVAAAGNYSLALDGIGQVWGWGLARFGVLGASEEGLVAEEAANLVNVEDEGLLLDVDAAGAEAEAPPLMYQPVPAIVSGLTGKHVVQMAAGDAHVLVVTERGLVYSWGDASLGCLGLSLEQVHRAGKLHPQDGLYMPQPRLLESLVGKEVIQRPAELGSHSRPLARPLPHSHRPATSEDDCVPDWWACGYTPSQAAPTRWGATTCSRNAARMTDFLTAAAKRQVAAADSHSMAVTSQGQVFGWGVARHGLLGRTDLPPMRGRRQISLFPEADDPVQPTPVLVPGLPSLRFGLPRVALGAFISMCVFARSEHTLSSDLEALLSSGNLADVEFSILPDKEEADADAPFVPAAACTFLAHRAVLVARSPFWATQFSTGMQGSSTPVGPLAAQQAVDGTSTSSAAHKLTISDCPSHVFKAVLLWIYTDRLDLDGMPPNDVVRMLCFADMVLLEDLRDKCSLWLQDQLTVDNVAVLWERASHANARGLEAACEAFMVCNFREVRESASFLQVYRREPRLADKMFARLTSPDDTDAKRRRLE